MKRHPILLVCCLFSCLFFISLAGCSVAETEAQKDASQGESHKDLGGLPQESGMPADSGTLPSTVNVEQIGRPCTTEADCGDPALGCLVSPRPICVVKCDNDTPCPGAECKVGTCPLCGDGYCTGPELQNASLCPADCAASASGGRSETFTLVNPQTGVPLHGEIFLPADASADQQVPGVVLVPGGTGSGEGFVAMGMTSSLVARGVIALIFDLDGRGQSNGTEDQCGENHQAGVNAMIEYLNQRPELAAGRLGVFSNSFGITCASGALATYRDTSPAKFLVDNEGPANRDDTAGCDGSKVGHINPLEHPCDDDTWWSLREASENIKRIRVPYFRIQKDQDHAQPDNNHAILMINSATDSNHGGSGESPWTVVNDPSINLPNTVYAKEEPPQWLQSCAVDCLVDDILLMMAQLP